MDSASRTKVNLYLGVIPRLLHVDWYRFLDRAPLPPPSARVLQALRGERILVTGAGGSIGGALALRLAELRPERLILLDHSEGHLFAIQEAVTRIGAGEDRTSFVLGNINDAALLEEAFNEHEPSIVFHTAAFKHAPVLERQPLTGIENNILGTAEVLKAAARHGARCVLLSTDKTVQPASMLGATKRVAEMLTLTQGGIVVRLANVLASSDSVAEIFARQIMEGGPVTVTDQGAHRYFLVIDEAVHLLLAATEFADEPAVFAPRLTKEHSIAALAEFLAAELAPASQVRIEYTELRPGDKKTEMLWSRDEMAEPVEGTGLMELEVHLPEIEILSDGMRELRTAFHERDVAAALEAVCQMVPDYQPGAVVLRVANHGSIGVAQ